MASTSAKINVIVDGLKQVQALERSLSNITSLTGKINGVSKTSGNAAAVEKKITSLKEAQRASMIRTRSIGDQIQKAEEQGLNVAKARRAINRAARADAKGELLISKEQADAAFRELKAEQEISKELRRQKQFRNIRGRRGSSVPRPARPNDRSNKAALTSGLISGAFPLLFGQNPLISAFGFAGGFAGTKLGGQKGGFAGGLVATAVLQQVGQLVSGIGNLGKALNPLTADINKLTKAVGLAGTVEGERLRLIEQLSGKQEALKVATATLVREIGQGGVQALKTFGKDFQAVANEFNKLLTNLGATIARIINATGIMEFFQTLLQVANQTFKPATKKLEEEFGVTSEAANTIKPLFTGKTKEQEQQIQFLENSLRIGEEEAKNRLEIAKHFDTIKHTLKDITQEEKEQLLIEQQNQLDNLNRIDELKDQLRLQTQIKDVLAVGMTNAIQGLILGTQTLSQSLSNIAKQLASIFLNRAFGALFSKIFFPGPSIPLPAAALSVAAPVIPKTAIPTPLNPATTLDLGSETRFPYQVGADFQLATGGYVSSPSTALIGEGGEPEYVIPSSKMSGAMARYSAGARGGAVIPGGSGASGTVAGSSGNTIVEYTGPVLNFNGDEYVPKSAVPEIINTAARQGGEAGKTKAISALRNSRSQRASLGL